MSRPPARAHEGLLLTIFFVSGACALTYQVLWVRWLSLVFGATSFAMAVVVGTFMAGLGLGSLLASRLAHRIDDPIRVYAGLELAVGLLGLGVPLVLPAVHAVQAAVLGVDAPLAVVLAVQGLLCAAVLILPTSCIGATLPVLSRWIATNRASRGADLGRLYAVNTLGAFAGTVLTGFVWIEVLGLSTTNALAAAANLAAAAGALRLAGGGGRRVPRVGPGRVPRKLLVAASMSGFLALAHEVVWSRLIGMVLITTTYAYTTILATVIGGIGVGSLLGARAADRGDPLRLFGGLQLGLGVSTAAIVPLLGWLTGGGRFLLDAPGDFLQTQLLAVAVCAGLTAVPSVLMGACFPALARAFTDRGGDVTQDVGRLYVVNTFAGVLGSVVAGFLLLPVVGALGSLSALALANLALGIALRPEPRAGVIALVLAVPLLRGASLEDLYIDRLPEGSAILHLAEGTTSTVMVADHADVGVRRVWIQSVWVAGTGGPHRMLGHLSMLHSAKPDRAVGIAFGTGQSFAASLVHGLEHLDCVDLNREVVDAGRVWFADANDGLLERPEVQVHIQDGRSFLARADTTWDAVMMEPLQPWSAGAVNLYTREFYELAAARMAPGASLTQWMPISDIPPALTRSVVATVAAVFPYTYVYLDGLDLWIVGATERPSLADWRERVSGEVAVDLRREDVHEVESLLALLLVGPADLDAYVGDAPLLTDDAPLLEFVAPRTMRASHDADNIAALTNACRDPLAGFTEAEQVPAVLRSCELQRLLAWAPVADANGDHDKAVTVLAAVGRSLPLSRVQRAWRKAAHGFAKQAEAEGRSDVAIAAYEAYLAVDPGHPEMRLNLGLVQARAQRLAAAADTLRWLVDTPGPTGDWARELLGRLEAATPGSP